VIEKEEMSGLMKLVNLEIEDKRIPTVLENLQRMEQVFQAVAAVELAPEDEIGPEWRP
jgi:Asp-tRNA(Asn)/Glu-tRNA(Gln) amidotransferase C subunit